MTEPATFDARAFRDALGCFATGVTIVTTKERNGTPVGMTVNSFTSVSLDPPLVLFSLRKSAYSLPAFTEAERFAVHVLAAGQGALSNRFATASAEKWEGVAHEHSEEGCVVLGGGLATFECARHAVVDGGDHLIFLGRVLRFRHAAGEPLLFMRGAYRSLAATAEEQAGRAPLTCFDPWFGG